MRKLIETAAYSKYLATNYVRRNYISSYRPILAAGMYCFDSHRAVAYRMLIFVT